MPGPGTLAPLQVVGSSGDQPSLVPAWGAAGNLEGAQELLGPQAALPIPVYHCKTVKEASTGLAGVKLPTLQFQPDQLCYETRAGHGGRKPEGPHIFSSRVG